jgi:pyridoxamine 5'-phosphate oxidase
MAERTLSESDIGDDPIALFSKWYAAAVAEGVTEPDAMALATADATGAPAVRFVLLKGWNDDGFAFYTNAGSDKGADLQANPRAALAWRWAPQDRQVRVTGSVVPVGDAVSDRYFASRARRSQIGAWASAQSRPLDARSTLEQRVAALEARYDGVEVPRPPYWYGWRVRPETMEFWQGRADRLHDRFRYRRSADGWEATRLAP